MRIHRDKCMCIYEHTCCTVFFKKNLGFFLPQHLRHLVESPCKKKTFECGVERHTDGPGVSPRTGTMRPMIVPSLSALTLRPKSKLHSKSKSRQNSEEDKKRWQGAKLRRFFPGTQSLRIDACVMRLQREGNGSPNRNVPIFRSLC
jgi:hypothetical protein